MPFDFAQGILSLSRMRDAATRAGHEQKGPLMERSSISCGREEVDGSESRPCQHAASPES